jgi:hypothetical protein
MVRYELGAVYQIKTDTEIIYYVRLLGMDCYGVFAPFEGELCEDTLSKTPYRLYFTCNTFPVKRGIWEKVLPSPDSKDVECWQGPKYLANFGNFNRKLFLEQHRAYYKGNPCITEKEHFIKLVKSGMINIIFNRHESIPSFLMRYYEDWPNSYIIDKEFIQSGTLEYQNEQLEVLNELGLRVLI